VPTRFQVFCSRGCGRSLFADAFAPMPRLSPKMGAMSECELAILSSITFIQMECHTANGFGILTRLGELWYTQLHHSDIFMDPALELLKEMRGRVPMYVGSNSLAKLATFLRGYLYALKKINAHKGDDVLPAFQEFVQTRYAVKISKAWEDIIFFQSIDDNEAIDTFWRLFDEFCQSASSTNK
jgi:hypothetical protein